MKIFAIRDEYDNANKDLAYLLYYDRSKSFYIELPDDADSWETPLILESFLKKGETTVNSYWSKVWVQQRIVPTDRQNLGQVLKDNGLSEYDEYDMLMLSMGRCSQDDYYLIQIDEFALPREIIDRLATKIDDVVPLEDFNLLVFFRNGNVKKCSLKNHFKKYCQFNIVLNNPNLFEQVQIQPGGYGITWDTALNISDSVLYEHGRPVPLSASDFVSFAKHRIINRAEAAELLDCSRQNIDDLTKRGKLHPIKTSAKNTLYLKSEIIKRSWL